MPRMGLTIFGKAHTGPLYRPAVCVFTLSRYRAGGLLTLKPELEIRNPKSLPLNPNLKT